MIYLPFEGKLSAQKQLGLGHMKGQYEEWLEKVLKQHNPIPKLVTVVNPSGAFIPRPMLERISDLCKNAGAWLVVDNTYDMMRRPDDDGRIARQRRSVEGRGGLRGLRLRTSSRECGTQAVVRRRVEPAGASLPVTETPTPRWTEKLETTAAGAASIRAGEGPEDGGDAGRRAAWMRMAPPRSGGGADESGATTLPARREGERAAPLLRVATRASGWRQRNGGGGGDGEIDLDPKRVHRERNEIIELCFVLCKFQKIRYILVVV
ncbi:hypothetical protein ACP4OV_024990 [Aristida adscensionis]